MHAKTLGSIDMTATAALLLLAVAIAAFSLIALLVGPDAAELALVDHQRSDGVSGLGLGGTRVSGVGLVGTR